MGQDRTGAWRGNAVAFLLATLGSLYAGEALLYWFDRSFVDGLPAAEVEARLSRTGGRRSSMPRRNPGRGTVRLAECPGGVRRTCDPGRYDLACGARPRIRPR